MPATRKATAARRRKADEEDVEMEESAAVSRPSVGSPGTGQKRKRFDGEDEQGDGSENGKKDRELKRPKADGDKVEDEDTDMSDGQVEEKKVRSTKPETAVNHSVNAASDYRDAIAASAATVTATSKMAAASLPKRTVPAVDNLRMPSKHTPGKTNETARLPRYSQAEGQAQPMRRTAGLNLDTPKPKRQPLATIANERQEDRRQPQVQTNGDVAGEEPSAMQRLFDAIKSFFGIDLDIEERPLGYVDEREESKGLNRTLNWLLILLLPQVILWSRLHAAVISGADFGIKVYKGSTPQNTTKTVVDTKRIRENMNTVNSLMTELMAGRKTLHDREMEIESKNKQGPSVKQAKISPEDAKSMLSQKARHIMALKKFVEKSEDQMSFSDISALDSIHKDLGESKLVDFSAVSLWEISDESDCAGSPSLDATIQADAIEEKEVNESVRKLMSDISDNVSTVKKSQRTVEAIKAWASDVVRSSIKDSDDDGTFEDDEESSLDDKSKSSKLRKMIDARLEVERADQTGLIDYASIANGARVITSGPQATTKSLVDQLPLINRMAHSLQLKFYGYGPAAALTPTHPTTALGQCWAFDKHMSSTSAFGRLSISLAKPVYVDAISIEHPTIEMTDQVSTAISQFRVLGFEDPGASGKIWRLGNFQYETKRDSAMRQTFEVETKGIPALSAISLAIDSNWGGPYACLYRFRVHGSEDGE